MSMPEPIQPNMEGVSDDLTTVPVETTSVIPLYVAPEDSTPGLSDHEMLVEIHTILSEFRALINGPAMGNVMAQFDNPIIRKLLGIK